MAQELVVINDNEILDGIVFISAFMEDYGAIDVVDELHEDGFTDKIATVILPIQEKYPNAALKNDVKLEQGVTKSSVKKAILSYLEMRKPKAVLIIGKLKPFITNKRQLVYKDGSVTNIYSFSQGKQVAYDNELVYPFLQRYKEFAYHVSGLTPKLPQHQSITCVEQLATILKTTDLFACDIETNTLNMFKPDAYICGFSFIPVFPDKDNTLGYYINFNVVENADEFIDCLYYNLLADDTKKTIWHGGQYDALFIEKAWGFKVNIYYDTMVAHHLIHEYFQSQSLKKLANIHFLSPAWEQGISDFFLANKIKKQDYNYAMLPDHVIAPYASYDAVYTLWLYNYTKLALKKQELTDYFFKISMPLCNALVTIKNNGFSIDKGYIAAQTHGLKTKITKCLSRIHAHSSVKEFNELALEKANKAIQSYKRLPNKQRQEQIIEDHKFNSASSAHLKLLVFDLLNIDGDQVGLDVNKTGYSLDKKNLLKLKGYGQIFDDIIEFRTISKQYGTYIKPVLSKWVQEDGLIHPSFLQANASFGWSETDSGGTVTGRLSSQQPNGQNLDAIIKKGIVSRYTDGVIVEFDYSQIELRMLGILTKEQFIIDAYAVDNIDLHQKLADMLGIPRQSAKRFWFALIYGSGAKLLAAWTELPLAEVKSVLKRLWVKFPKTQEFIDTMTTELFKDKYVKSLWGRRRHLLNITSSEQMLSSKSKRQAFNFLVQSAAADVTNQSIINVNNYLIQNRCMSKIVLTVHDSIILDVHPEEYDIILYEIKDIMEDFNLSLPIKVDCSVGYNWFDKEQITL